MLKYIAFAAMLSSVLAVAQQPQGIQNYAPYNIALLPAVKGGEVVLPFFTSENKVVFFPLSQVLEASKEGKLLGRPISYGEVVALIGQLQIEVNQLKEENEKLWRVVGKPVTAQTVVVQAPAPASPTPSPSMNDAAAKAMLLQQLFPPPQQSIRVNISDCTRLPALCVGR